MTDINSNTTKDSRQAEWRETLRRSIPASKRTAQPRAVMPMADASSRTHTMDEVNLGLSPEQALVESHRCLDCPDPSCVTGCPVGIDIPGFIKHIEAGDLPGASATIRQYSSLPAVCGRVCPQERQCESRCIYNKMKKPPVAIGYLERFVADNTPAIETIMTSSNGIKVAVAGSGPAGLTFAGEMARRGFEVTVFEALHEIGGVLKYGIPQFRLPNAVVDREIDALRAEGVTFVKDCIIGATLSQADLEREGFKGLFVASGAGLPRFMGIPGENLNGILSSNEYLTRINLMGAGTPGYETPVPTGRTVAVIGGGNTAMDSVRTSLRMGAERALLIYRRSMDEMPARAEEILHAQEEGVEFMPLHNPIEYLGDEKGRVRTIRLQRMQLGEPDSSGRRSPVPIEGDTVDIDVDVVVVSVGVSPNPLIPNSFHDIDTTSRGTIEVNPDTLQSSVNDVYAGGDIVRGGATVILAMGDGRRAAENMAARLLGQ